MNRSEALHLKGLLERDGPLAKVLALVRAEVDSLGVNLTRYDLETDAGLSEARKLQGKIRGGQMALERIEELINEYARDEEPGVDAEAEH